jgi:hypothetical protein
MLFGVRCPTLSMANNVQGDGFCGPRNACEKLARDLLKLQQIVDLLKANELCNVVCSLLGTIKSEIRREKSAKSNFTICNSFSRHIEVNKDANFYYIYQVRLAIGSLANGRTKEWLRTLVNYRCR